MFWSLPLKSHHHPQTSSVRAYVSELFVFSAAKGRSLLSQSVILMSFVTPVGGFVLDCPKLAVIISFVVPVSGNLSFIVQGGGSY